MSQILVNLIVTPDGLAPGRFRAHIPDDVDNCSMQLRR
jgi:hypothetical protein